MVLPLAQQMCDGVVSAREVSLVRPTNGDLDIERQING